MPARERIQALIPADLLESATLRIIGQLRDASNATWIAQLVVDPPADGPLVIYKPIAGEAPLWDFPHGTLAARERAAYLISAVGGWDVIPATVLRSGPAGDGMVQEWIGDLETVGACVVQLVDPADGLDGLIPVLRAQGEDGRPLVVAHEDAPDVRSLAVLDVVLNNTDRKGAHAFRHLGRLYGVDHGVTLHTENKLRTVLWGWAGQPLPESEMERLRLLGPLLAPGGELATVLAPLITAAEVKALTGRVSRLLRAGVHPSPGGRWPAIPWPPI